MRYVPIKLLLLFLCCLCSTKHAQSQEITSSGLPPKDVLIYLDNSGTIVKNKLRNERPNELIRNALTQIFSYQTGTERLIEPEDRISIYSFGDRLIPLGTEIPGANSEFWQGLLNDYGSPDRSPDRYTNFAEVLSDISGKLSPGGVLDGRPFVVFIASDFVHEFDRIDTCSFSADPFSRASPVSPALNALVDARNLWREQHGLPQFLALLPINPDSPYKNKAGTLNEEAHRCYEQARDAASLPKILQERLGAQRLNYGSLERDTARFVTDFAQRYFDSFAKPTAVVDVEYEIVGDGDLNLRLDLENTGTIATDISAVTLLTFDKREIAAAALGRDEQNIIPGSRRSISFNLTGQQRRELFSSGSYLVDINEEATRRNNFAPFEVKAPPIVQLLSEGAPRIDAEPGGSFTILVPLVNGGVRDNRIERAEVTVQIGQSQRRFEVYPVDGEAEIAAGQRRNLRVEFRSQQNAALVAAQPDFELQIFDRSRLEAPLVLGGTAGQNREGLNISVAEQIKGDQEGNHTVTLRLSHSGAGLPVTVDQLRFYPEPSSRDGFSGAIIHDLKPSVILVPGGEVLFGSEGTGGSIKSVHLETIKFDSFDSADLLEGQRIKVQALSTSGGSPPRVLTEGAEISVPSRRALDVSSVQEVSQVDGQYQAILQFRNRGRIANRLISVRALDPDDRNNSYELLLPEEVKKRPFAASAPSSKVAVPFDLDKDLLDRLLSRKNLYLAIEDQSHGKSPEPNEPNVVEVSTGEKKALGIEEDSVTWATTAEGLPILTFQVENTSLTPSRLDSIGIYSDDSGTQERFRKPFALALVIPPKSDSLAEPVKVDITFERQHADVLAQDQVYIRLHDGAENKRERPFGVKGPEKRPLKLEQPEADINGNLVTFDVKNESSLPNTLRGIRIFSGTEPRVFKEEIPLNSPILLTAGQERSNVVVNVDETNWRAYQKENGIFIQLNDDSPRNSNEKADNDQGAFVKLDSIDVVFTDVNVQHFPNQDEVFRVSVDLNLERDEDGEAAIAPLAGTIRLVNDETGDVINGPVDFTIERDAVKSKGYFVFQISRPDIALEKVSAVVEIPNVKIEKTKSINPKSWVEIIKLNVIETYLIAFFLISVASAGVFYFAFVKIRKIYKLSFFQFFTWRYFLRIEAVISLLTLVYSGTIFSGLQAAVFGDSNWPYSEEILNSFYWSTFFSIFAISVIIFYFSKRGQMLGLLIKGWWITTKKIEFIYWFRAASVSFFIGLLLSQALDFFAAPIADMDEVNPVLTEERFEKT